MMQDIIAGKYGGERIKVSRFLKAQDIHGFCGFWMRVDSSHGDVLQFDNMSDRPITERVNGNHYYID
ncbi:hypothetical protein ACFSCX_22775 [Bacillus salitolerans]|uniref:Uncharacterized protein n=1 Tax=Bacillus salitolerans TaxID=1437434 RepID=A0ABW4LVU8_9BACI